MMWTLTNQVKKKKERQAIQVGKIISSIFIYQKEKIN